MTAKQLIESVFEDFSDIDDADLACLFVEEEVGMYDWHNNLKTIQGELGDNGLKEAIKLWLEATGRTGRVPAIIKELNRLQAEYPGERWNQMLKPRTPIPSTETFRNPLAAPEAPPGVHQMKIPPQPLGGSVSSKKGRSLASEPEHTRGLFPVIGKRSR